MWARAKKRVNHRVTLRWFSPIQHSAFIHVIKHYIRNNKKPAGLEAVCSVYTLHNLSLFHGGRSAEKHRNIAAGARPRGLGA